MPSPATAMRAILQLVALCALATVGFHWVARLRYSVHVTADGGPNGNRTLSRAATLLDSFAESPELTGVELADRAGLARSTTHRLALALVEYGFLKRTAQGSFSLGPRMVQPPLERLATGVLERLAGSTRETAQLWVRRGTVRVCLASAEGKHELRVVAPVGTYVPLEVGSAGKILSGDRAAQLAVADQGWADSLHDGEESVASVSAPVYRYGEIIAVVAVVLPSSRVTLSAGDDFGYEVAAAAAALSEGLAE